MDKTIHKIIKLSENSEFVYTDLDAIRENLKEKAIMHKTRDGKVIHIDKMSNSHLNNLILFYENTLCKEFQESPEVDTHAYDVWIDILPRIVPLKDSSLFNSIKYDLLINEKHKRESKEEGTNGKNE